MLDTLLPWRQRAHLPARPQSDPVSANFFGIDMGRSNDRLMRRGTDEALRAYAESPWIRAITGRIGDGVASTQWLVLRPVKSSDGVKRKNLQRMYNGRGKAAAALVEAGRMEVVENHPFLDLMHRGATTQDPDHVWFNGREVVKLWQLYLDLAGEGFGVMETGPSGPTSIWPVPPTWMDERPTLGGSAVYQMNPTYGLGGGTSIPADHVMWLKEDDPRRPFGPGTGITQSVGDEVDTDEAAAKTARQAFYNGARPDLLLIPKDPVEEEELQSFIAQWNQKLRGYWNANKVHATSVQLDVHQIGANFRELQFTELRTWERDLMVQCFGVPPEILGILQNSNRSTIEASDFHWTSKVLVPRIDLMAAAMQWSILPMYPDSEDLVVSYVSPVEEDKAFQIDAMKALPYAFHIDEIRSVLGFPSLPDDAGKVFPNPLGLVATTEPLSDPFDFDDPGSASEPGEPVDEGDDEPDGTSLTDAQARALIDLADRVLGGFPRASALEIAQLSFGLSAAEAARIIPPQGSPPEPAPAPSAADAKSIQVRSLGRVQKATDKQIIDSLPELVIQFELGPVAEATVADVGAAEIATFTPSIEFNMSDPDVIKWLRKKGAERVTNINKTTKRALRKILNDNADAGANEIAELIGKKFQSFQGRRAQLIGQMETSMASNFAVQESYDQGGIDEKMWLSARDGRQRDTHKLVEDGGMDGQVVAVDANFKSPSGATGPYPTQMSTKAENMACRCLTLAVIDGQTAAGDSEKKRVEIWKVSDRRRMRHQKEMLIAIRRAFRRQAKAVIDTVLGS